MVARRTLLASAGAGIALTGLAVRSAHADQDSATTYHVASDGSDDADGTTPERAWATTERVNATDLRPGDQVLFRRGDRWTGNLVITDSGTHEAPIVIGAWGSGPRPRIDGALPAEDVLAATVLVHNAEHVHVRDLELTNTADEEGMRNGVLVAVDEPTQPVYSGYLITNLDIHDVSGRIEPSANDAKRSGGIGVVLDGSSDAVSRLDDIVITDNTVRHVDQTGIWIDGNLRSKELPPGTDVVFRGYTWDQIKYTGVEIAHNRVSDTARNGIILRMAEDGHLHHNEVSETSDRVHSGNSVFTVSVFRCVVEWNEVHHNLSHDTADGAAFDPDLDSPETVWRYNFSHHNNYGLLTMCTRPRDYGIEVHQNIDIAGRGRLLNLNYGFSGVTFRNNAFWAKPVPEVEYPDTHPEYVNPDRETAAGYPQLVWETHERTGTNFEAEQTYRYVDNVVLNEAPTATCYVNRNDADARRVTNRALEGNVVYGIEPTDLDLLGDGIRHGGIKAPARWIAETVGHRVHAFWLPSIEGRRNPRIGPRAETAG